MATETDKPTTSGVVQQTSDFLIASFPEMDTVEQKLALTLYRLLARGAAVSTLQLANTSGQAVDTVQQTLGDWPGVLYDEDNNVTGFWGLATQEMPHQLKVNGHMVYAWCAWDTLFIPGLLDTSVQVTSRCPVSGQPISLTVSSEHIEAMSSDEIVVSFLMPDKDKFTDNILASFCHYVFFFRSQEDGEQWVAQHPGTFLLSLDEAFAIGKKMNAARYHLALKLIGQLT